MNVEMNNRGVIVIDKFIFAPEWMNKWMSAEIKSRGVIIFAPAKEYRKLLIVNSRKNTAICKNTSHCWLSTPAIFARLSDH